MFLDYTDKHFNKVVSALLLVIWSFLPFLNFYCDKIVIITS